MANTNQSPEARANQALAELAALEKKKAELEAAARDAEREARARSVDRFTVEDSPHEYALARVVNVIELVARQAGVDVGDTTPVGVALAEARDAIAVL